MPIKKPLFFSVGAAYRAFYSEPKNENNFKKNTYPPYIEWLKKIICITLKLR
jgi:hypothetical protein